MSMEWNEFKEACAGLGAPVAIGMTASFVRLSRSGPRSWRRFLSSVSTSCFVGILVHWGLDYAAFPPTVDAAVIGISSYMGGSLLDAVHDRVISEVRHAGDLERRGGRGGFDGSHGGERDHDGGGNPESESGFGRGHDSNGNPESEGGLGRGHDGGGNPESDGDFAPGPDSGRNSERARDHNSERARHRAR